MLIWWKKTELNMELSNADYFYIQCTGHNTLRRFGQMIMWSPYENIVISVQGQCLKMHSYPKVIVSGIRTM